MWRKISLASGSRLHDSPDKKKRELTKESPKKPERTESSEKAGASEQSKASHPPGIPTPTEPKTSENSIDFDFNDFFKNFDNIPGLGVSRGQGV